MTSVSAEVAEVRKLGWELGKELGSGHFAKVKLGVRNSDGAKSAVKIIKKPKSKSKQIMVEVLSSCMEEAVRLYLGAC